MAAYKLENLREGYESAFASMRLKDERLPEIDGLVSGIVDRRAVYRAIMEATGVPWQIVGVIHSMEDAQQRLTVHLHNGDPLSARTYHVPSGRPPTGSPPFTFAESAIDALTYDKLAGLDAWGLGETCFRLERYNGFGFRNKGVPTPYLWSYSDRYTSGKFIEVTINGKNTVQYKPNLVSKQCGAAAMLRRMVDQGVFSFDDLPQAVGVTINGTPKPVPAFVIKGNSWLAARALAKVVPGLELTAAGRDPFVISFLYRRPGAPPETQTFPGKLYRDVGYVDASDIVQGLLGAEIAFADGPPATLAIRLV